MPVEMIGWIAPRVSSELIPPSGPVFDTDVIAETARIHEEAGFVGHYLAKKYNTLHLYDMHSSLPLR